MTSVKGEGVSVDLMNSLEEPWNNIDNINKR